MKFIKYLATILSFLGTINSAIAADDMPDDDTLAKKETKSLKQVVKEEVNKRKVIIPSGFKSHTPKISHTDLTAMLAGSVGIKRLNQENLELPCVYEKIFPSKSTIYKYYSPTLDTVSKIGFSDIISFKYSTKPSPSSETNIVTLCYFLITPKPEKDKKAHPTHAFIIAYYYKKDWLNLKEDEKRDLEFAINETILGWACLYREKLSPAVSSSSQQATKKENKDASNTRRRSRSIGGMDPSDPLLVAIQAAALNIPTSPTQEPVSFKQKIAVFEQKSVPSTQKPDSHAMNSALHGEKTTSSASKPKGPAPLLQTKGKATSFYTPNPAAASPSRPAVPPLSFSQTPPTAPIDTPSPRGVKKLKAHTPRETSTRQRSGSFSGIFDGTRPSPYSLGSPPTPSSVLVTSSGSPRILPLGVINELGKKINSSRSTSPNNSEDDSSSSK